jgi:hypothetical protein
VSLDPLDPLEREEKRRQKSADRFEQLACSIHERVFRVLCAPSPCPSPPPGARGSKRLPLPRRGRGSG